MLSEYFLVVALSTFACIHVRKQAKARSMDVVTLEVRVSIGLAIMTNAQYVSSLFSWGDVTERERSQRR